jgi:trigger factor
VKSAVETLSPTRVRLTVEVPFEELNPSLRSTYREIARQVNIPGFRKGKVPPQIIDQRIGREYVLQQAVNEAIPRFYVTALQENEVEPLGQPSLEVEEIQDGANLKFTAEVDVRPEIELPDYTGLEVSVEDADVTDEDVEAELTSLRERFGTLVTVDRPAGEGDYVTIDLSGSKDGQLIEDAQATGISYRVGSGSMLEGLDEAVRGKRAGESATFVSQLASGQYVGEDVDVTVTVQAVREQQLPELNDEFAQLASEFDTLEELRADLRERLTRMKRLQQARQAQDAVLKALLERVEVPLPEGALADEVRARREAIRHQLSHAGITEAQYLKAEGQSEEEFVADLEQRAREAMKAQFVLDTLADKEELTVSEPELTQALLQRAQQAGVSPEEYVQQVVQANYVPTLVREVRRSKALAVLVENAVVTDSSGRAVDLKRLRPDGTLAPEEGEGDQAEARDQAEGPDQAEDAGSARSAEEPREESSDS